MPAPDPDCPRCGGTGMVRAEPNPPHPPRFHRCGCVVRLDILQNVERAMVGLSMAPPVRSSPLLGREDQNTWITAGEDFLSHLRHVGVRQPITYLMKVVTDAELTTSWLSSIALQGKDILDADAYKVSTRYLSIPDLVLPPDLVIIRMGIKVTRNQAAAECLGEALNIRHHEGKPTWLWDEPLHPLDAGHLFWSDQVARILRSWDHLELKPNGGEPPGRGGKNKTSPSSTSTTKKQKRKSLRGGG